MDDKERIPIGNNLITINNQNLEEAEELEDRKRREEEIHNLLSHAMGEFNFDDQSTINSSTVSKEGDDNILPNHTQTAFEEQYQQANADEQLKVLYEVRVREVVALNKELERLKAEFSEQEKLSKKKVSLLEIESERKNISLKENQDLLVAKIEQINNLDGHLENAKVAVKNLEANVAQLNQENLILREENMKLEQQLTLMERGFPLRNQTADKELEESRRNKITQLENSLEKAVEQSECKERQHKKLVRELKQCLHEKDDYLLEKDALINKLSENFDAAQRRCQELLRTVEELRNAQKTTNHAESPLEEELRKIREYNERTDVLCENVRKMVSEEFQGQIAVLNSENTLLKDTLAARENEFKEVQQQLQIMSTIETERNLLQTKLMELKKKFEEVNLHKDSVNQKLAECKKDRNSLNEKCKQLTMDNESLINTKEENQNLHKRILDLETYINETANPAMSEKFTQASISVVSSAEVENLNKEKEDIYNKLLSALATADQLENKIRLLLQENAQLKERENLIEKLQDKAAQFEKIIFEKRKKLIESATVSTGTNTETCQDNNSVLKVKYDALLYQTETNLRKKLKQEFDAKLEKLMHEANRKLESRICEDCNELRNKHTELHELRMQDRQSVAKLVDNWTEKFGELEKESRRNMTDLKTIYDRQLLSNTIKLEQEYADRVKKISERLMKTTMEVEHRKDKLVHSSLLRYNLLNERLIGILTKIRHSSEEIAVIEKQYLKEEAAVQIK